MQALYCQMSWLLKENLLSSVRDLGILNSGLPFCNANHQAYGYHLTCLHHTVGARLPRADTPTTASSVSSVSPCPDLDISGLLSASMKLWHAYLLARKQGKI